MSEKVRQIISESVLEFQVSRLARGERVAKADIAPLDAYNAGVASQAARIAALEPQLAERDRELAAAKERIGKLEAGLRDLEWSAYDECGPSGATCPNCAMYQIDGHARDCGLAALLEEI